MVENTPKHVSPCQQDDVLRCAGGASQQAPRGSCMPFPQRTLWRPFCTCDAEPPQHDKARRWQDACREVPAVGLREWRPQVGTELGNIFTCFQVGTELGSIFTWMCRSIARSRSTSFAADRRELRHLVPRRASSRSWTVWSG